MGMLDGKVAVITGAGGGIGSASARMFAAEGARLVLTDVRLDAAQAVADEVAKGGGEAIAVALDVSQEDQVRTTVARALEQWGRVDILLNNAGVALQGTLIGTSVEDWDRVMAINTRGTWLMMKHCAPAMGGSGSIVNISSVAALMSVREASAYTASKGAVLSLTRVAAAELGPGIRVNCICPGTVRTAMPEEMLRNRGGGDAEAGAALTAQKYLLARLGEPEEIASTALFLAGPGSSFFTGAVLAADGGVTAQ
jgi:NAD(P)-dependent dehydrogenase (short-subunit alcohol dehydrogenase family)